MIASKRRKKPPHFFFGGGGEGGGGGGARVAWWWEHSPHTHVARVRILASTSYVVSVCCLFPPLLREEFLQPNSSSIWNAWTPAILFGRHNSNFRVSKPYLTVSLNWNGLPLLPLLWKLRKLTPVSETEKVATEPHFSGLPRCKNLWTCFFFYYYYFAPLVFLGSIGLTSFPCFLYFTSPVSSTGSFTEDKPISTLVRVHCDFRGDFALWEGWKNTCDLWYWENGWVLVHTNQTCLRVYWPGVPYALAYSNRAFHKEFNKKGLSRWYIFPDTGYDT